MSESGQRRDFFPDLKFYFLRCTQYRRRIMSIGVKHLGGSVCPTGGSWVDRKRAFAFHLPAIGAFRTVSKTCHVRITSVSVASEPSRSPSFPGISSTHHPRKPWLTQRALVQSRNSRRASASSEAEVSAAGDPSAPARVVCLGEALYGESKTSCMVLMRNVTICGVYTV